ncbi:hypothetical protein ACFPT7_21385 [Acidicapsa dinghuensis]|uniref:Peptidase M56 domain-containing protein n=1 Tax=Acidicapsa dinghuensis TaxID=2218256 RepID=A0ABW1EKW0_9BACT|nr:hypothetical protein [Acidicapsa dinghuensis]
MGQITTHAAAFLFAVLLLLPHYLTTEVNHLSERIGGLSVGIAAFAAWRYLWAFCNGLCMYLRSIRLRAALTSANSFEHSATPATLLRSSKSYPPLAVIGLTNPTILIAETLLGPSGLRAEALAVALDHERAHLEHKDNWKLLLLHCLPSLGFQTQSHPTPMRLWLRYSDWAADDEAARGSKSRALTLAESLVSCARLIPVEKPNYLFTGLATHEEELQSRIDRLLQTPPCTPGSANKKFLLFTVIAVLTVFAFVFAIEPWLSAAAEVVLHLG